MPQNRKLQNLLDGRNTKVMDDGDNIGMIPVLYLLKMPAGGADVTLTLERKFCVADAWVVMLGAGTGGDSIVLKNGSNAITDTLDVSGKGDKDITHFGEIDDAQYEVAAGGTLVGDASGGGPAMNLYVLGWMCD